MTSLQRTVKCSNCGSESSVSVNSDLDLKEFTFAGKCAKCGSTLQITYSIVSTNGGGTTSSSSSDSSSPFSLDEKMMSPEFPSDAIRDLIED
ncbi:hypothetical protein HY990_02075 [Candidatus Micrarchaeota archaeon]|nr:hypothetical protein [Candidatus Micrarchaeota archaeon]